MNQKEFIELLEKEKITPVQITTFVNKGIEVKILNNKQKELVSSNNTSYTITAHYNDKDVKVNTNY